MTPLEAGRRSRWALALAIVVLLGSSLVAALKLHPSHPQRTSSAPTPVSHVDVVRTDLVSRQVITGSLGYAGNFTIVNHLQSGVLTQAPAVGDLISRGQQLYAADGGPVVLLYGTVPSWRPFRDGMTAGPDVAQLNANLTALGDEPTGHADMSSFNARTAAGLRHLANGVGSASSLGSLGRIVFLPGPIRVTSTPLPLATPLAPGAVVAVATTTVPQVSINVDPNTAARVHTGDEVSVTLPTGHQVQAGVTSVATVATTATGSNGSSDATISVTVRLPGTVDPQVTDQAPVEVGITDRRVDHVLAVPITALLAQPHGEYAVLTTESNPRLITVSLGLYDESSGLVEASGVGLTEGLQIVTAAS